MNDVREHRGEHEARGERGGGGRGPERVLSPAPPGPEPLSTRRALPAAALLRQETSARSAASADALKAGPFRQEGEEAEAGRGANCRGR